MKKRLGILAVLLTVSPGVPAIAQDSSPVPDIVGTWTGDFKLMRWAGPAEQSLEVRVLAQDGALLKGEKAWMIKPGGTAGDAGGKPLTEAVEPLVGVIGFDGTIYFAEQDDSGLYTGRLSGPDTLELVYVEAGQVATAYRAILTRAK